jgi:hypothetical protein
MMDDADDAVSTKDSPCAGVELMESGEKLDREDNDDFSQHVRVIVYRAHTFLFQIFLLWWRVNTCLL